MSNVVEHRSEVIGLEDVLVVDDRPSNIAAVEAILGEFPNRLVKAQSGAEALRHLLENDFALVLLDVQMPEMNGFETARLIRQRHRSRHTPIIFLTAHPSDNSDIIRAYELGAVDFLFKPIVPEVLRAKVSVLLELQRRTKEVARQAELLRSHERREHERHLLEERRRWEAEALRLQMEDERKNTVELAKRAAELLRTVSELERAEHELTRMNRELAEVDRRKDEFLAVLAHELRNPLAPIVSCIDLLRIEVEPEPDDPVNRVLSTMSRQINHLTRLVDDLLDISRINSGKIELKKTFCDLRVIAEQAFAASRSHIDERRHEVELSLPDQPVVSEVDGVRVAQVISNLLNNAARYTEPGGRIRLSIEIANEHAVIRVSDNGQGIEPELIDRVFDMFVQRDSGGGGLGVGLALVKRMVELHGGVISAKSHGRGHGTEFAVKLPLAVGQAPEIEMHEKRRVRESTAPPPLSVVLVDDNEDIRDLVAELLVTHGHTVSQAATGRQGLELIGKLEPDAAIVDLGLPDVDGWTVAKNVRDGGNSKTRLVAMSGYGQQSDRERAMESGFDAHLVKPAHIDAILQAISPAAPKAATSEPKP